MRAILKSGFFWRFVGGFAIGAAGFAALQPAQAVDIPAIHAAR